MTSPKVASAAPWMMEHGEDARLHLAEASAFGWDVH